jgi:hypothetical protein
MHGKNVRRRREEIYRQEEGFFLPQPSWQKSARCVGGGVI